MSRQASQDSVGARGGRVGQKLSPLEAREASLSGLVPETHEQTKKDHEDSHHSHETNKKKEYSGGNEEEEEEEEEFTLPQTPLDSAALAQACMTIDALGPEVRTRLIQSFCSDQLQPYRNLFQPRPSSMKAALLKRNLSARFPADGDGANEDPASLDQIERRFAWYRRQLQSVEEAFDNVFPPHWKVQYQLTVVFLQQVRAAKSVAVFCPP